jgi:hypothetical protein
MITVPRHALSSSDWNRYVQKHTGGWWWHRSEWLDYSLAYRPDAVDHSVAFVSEKGNLIGVIPAIVDNDRIAMGDDPCIAPLVNKRLHVEQVMDLLDSTSILSFPFAWRWCGDPVEQQPTSVVAGLVKRGNVSLQHWATKCVDLRTASSADLWKGMRRSYKSLIHTAERKYLIVTGGAELWNDYEQCHKAMATRPRSQETYDFQRDWVCRDRARIVVAYDSGGLINPPVGFRFLTPPRLDDGITGGSSPPTSTRPVAATAMAFVYKKRAYYASAASREPNVQHACQWAMMCDMASNSIQKYEIGWVGRADDGIEFFKQGFGGELVNMQAVVSDQWEGDGVKA